jgi:Na+/H+-dicarboxylate symporter
VNETTAETSKSRLHWWVLLGMGIGAGIGALAHVAYGPDAVGATAVYQAFDGIASIFLKLLRMIVIPLVFFSLISGMVGMGNLARLGRMGVKTFLLYILTSLLAILLGLTLVNVIRPGVGLEITIPTEAVSKDIPDSFWDVIANMIPDNVAAAAASFDVLGVIIFALFFGAFLLTVRGDRKKALVALIEGASEVMMKMTAFIISLAPVGIAALIARLVASTGPGVFLEMGWYILTVLLALGGHLLITLPLLVYFATGRHPYRYLRVMSPALLTGFSTASSAGTLAVTMDRVERGAGVSNRVASFVLPIGATVNMDGTALYEIVSVLFIAQLHSGLDPSFTLSFGQQILIVFLGLTVSIGAAGIPHAGLVMMVIILQAVGLPVEYTGLIWAVDRVLDMCRTAVNIASDSSITLIVAHTENQIDDSVLGNRSAA